MSVILKTLQRDLRVTGMEQQPCKLKIPKAKKSCTALYQQLFTVITFLFHYSFSMIDASRLVEKSLKRTNLSKKKIFRNLLTLSVLLTSAPASRRSSTIPKCPRSTASIRGVWPDYEEMNKL